MKKILFYLLLLVPMERALGQTTETAPSAAEIAAAIDQSAAAIRTLRGEFTQTKELSILRDKMVSHGVLYYEQQGGKLRWEYLTPYTYVFILNGDRVQMRSQEHTQTVGTSDNRIFREIARIMMNSLTGRCLTDTSDFRTEIRVAGGMWIAELTPSRREMQQFFAKIRLGFDPRRHLVSRVEMLDPNGDRTVIELKNIQTDQKLDEKVFAID